MANKLEIIISAIDFYTFIAEKENINISDVINIELSEYVSEVGI